MSEVKRNVVKLGLDFQTIPLDIGDGVVWEFVSDPSPHQWSSLLNGMKAFTRFSGLDEDNFDESVVIDALNGLSESLAGMLSNGDQKKAWIERGYGLGPQQAVAEYLMEAWTGFPTKQDSRSGQGSKTTG